MECRRGGRAPSSARLHIRPGRRRGPAAAARAGGSAGTPRRRHQRRSTHRAWWRSCACRRRAPSSPAARRCARARRSAASCRVSSSSRCDRSEIMPRQCRLAWLSRARCNCRVSARISAMACCATASAFTPCALASRTPAAASASRAYWSVPALIDWMKASRGASRDELVAPQHRDREDIEFAEPRRELVEAAHLEMSDAGPAQRKALRHAIGDVGKADREVFFSGEGAHVDVGPCSPDGAVASLRRRNPGQNRPALRYGA